MLPRATPERNAARSGEGPARRAHARDPAPDRARAARGRRHGEARRAHGDRRLRRDRRRRRDADGVDHRRVGRAGARARASISIRQKKQKWPLIGQIAAVSVGIVGGTPVLDLPYEEDSRAEVDMNVAMTDAGGFVEVQGTAEREPFDRARSSTVCWASPKAGSATLFDLQREPSRSSRRGRRACLTASARGARRDGRRVPHHRPRDARARRTASSARSRPASVDDAAARAYLRRRAALLRPVRARGAGPAATRRPRARAALSAAVQPHGRARRGRQARRGGARRPGRAR